MEVKMQATYRLHTDELTGDFLDSIKQMFRNKNIKITIIDEDEEEFGIEHSFIVSSMDEARDRVAIARASEDNISEEEYKNGFVF
jgi:hypothetical protein